MDWAMKFLPTYHREKQSDFFAKAGISWHETVVFIPRYYNSSLDGAFSNDVVYLQKITFTQLVDQCKQDWMAVFLLLQNVFKKVKEKHPQICNAFLQSDNAACYHSAPLLFALGFAGAATGIKVISFFRI